MLQETNSLLPNDAIIRKITNGTSKKHWSETKTNKTKWGESIAGPQQVSEK
jgi:hypothetical protein